MKPRIFVSSTYYDLKYIRNNIEGFILKYGFEPVLFESGNVYFEPGTELDLSCYNEVKQCHMMILVIGGRYGAPSSEDNNETYMANYEKNYISITRKEFREAYENKLPIFIFIDKNVQAEYYTYSKNKELYKKFVKDENFEFAHVDNINVFEFIEEVKNIAFCPFERYEDIEKYLVNQWSSMFYSYLISLKEKNEADKILTTVYDLQNVSEKINDMVDVIGKKILEGSNQYENVIKTQNRKQIKFYSEKIVNDLFGEIFGVLDADDKSSAFHIMEILVDKLFSYKFPILSNKKIDTFEFWVTGQDEKVHSDLQNELKKLHAQLSIEKNKVTEVLIIYNDKIKSTFNVNGNQEYFKKVLEEEIENKLKCPF